MVKGFVFFKEGKIPFVIENYRMVLYSDDNLASEFSREYNFKANYILQGLCFSLGIQGQKATFFVEHSMGCTLYLRCYIIYMLASEEEYDTVGFQSPFLDDVFRYKYRYIDAIREGSNLAVEPKVVYRVPLSMNDRQYELEFRIGHDNRLGLLEDFDRKGELLLLLQTDDIQECFDLSVVLYRLAMFMTSHAEVPFKQITLYNDSKKVGWFYCPLISDEAFSGYDVFFCELDAMKYVPKILNNIALDSGNKITKSIPLGHLENYESIFSPQRFMEQVMAFEYLFDKLDHKKAQDKTFPLKDELSMMFNEFPQLLLNHKLSSNEVGEQIKKIRRTIAHGYAYYYSFNDDPEVYPMSSTKFA
ncbi:MAG: hypothetical protein PHI27_08360 [Eubacteriales bacterium]|nr:hypothetical protein [Eubacteriales bacterium]MDD3882251.1 hypothetical protein [Eubacteriales bacterium]MDD4511997.1 hypothetical protein [Eubacteriales bacterium]